jgi:hypothetical protein
MLAGSGYVERYAEGAFHRGLPSDRTSSPERECSGYNHESLHSITRTPILSGRAMAAIRKPNVDTPHIFHAVNSFTLLDSQEIYEYKELLKPALESIYRWHRRRVSPVL